MEQREIELLIQELQNRIGQITTQYETELAAIKVQAHTKIEALEEEVASLKGSSEEE